MEDGELVSEVSVSVMFGVYLSVGDCGGYCYHCSGCVHCETEPGKLV